MVLPFSTQLSVLRGPAIARKKLKSMRKFEMIKQNSYVVQTLCAASSKHFYDLLCTSHVLAMSHSAKFSKASDRHEFMIIRDAL